MLAYPHGGADWDVLSTPFPFAIGNWDIVAPRAGADTFFAFQTYLGLAQVPPPQPFWVTHDAGSTWRRVALTPGDASSLFAALETFSSAIYRDGMLYALQPPTKIDYLVPKTFTCSGDDGKTWVAAESGPSSLEREGWQVLSFAADYSTAHAWYRVLVKSGTPPMLEHSTDDGRTWTSVGVIGNLTGASDGNLDTVTIATTPARPAALCAGNDGVWLAGSGDGGRSWRDGQWPSLPAHAQGLADSPVEIGSDGTCYHTFKYQVVTDPSSLRSGDVPFHSVILHLMPDQSAPYLVSFSDDFGLSLAIPLGVPSWAYVPAGHGMSGRLVVHADNYSLSPIHLIQMMLMGVTESRDDFLLWTAVP